MEKTTSKLICLTPVRNEQWILERFLHCASMWADHIILADQGSVDRSREIASGFPKVRLIENKGRDYSEDERQKLLIDEARKIAGDKILIALDVDEIFSVNSFSDPEWETMLGAPPGTSLWFRWANLTDGGRRYWDGALELPLGYVDDGRDHVGNVIHSGRLPCNPAGPSISFKEIRVLHYQYMDWDRMKSKHRWYQCFERLRDPEVSAVQMYRAYHHMDHISGDKLKPLPSRWIEGYKERGIDVTSIAKDGPYWWDLETLEFFRMHGVKRFKKEAIWDENWASISANAGIPDATGPITEDPRSMLDRLVHRYLARTQRYTGGRVVRLVDRILQSAGW